MPEARTYRKTATVQAMQWDGSEENTAAILTWAHGLVERAHGTGVPELIVWTLEGPLHMQIGHWLLRGTKGEFWPNRDDTFTEAYTEAYTESDGEDEITGQTSDGYHTFDELYEFRMFYHATLVHAWRELGLWEGAAPETVKSWRHSDGEECFGGGWFIVVTTLWPGAQISNHYQAEHWDLFDCREVARPPKFDGHTPGDVIERLREYLRDD